MTKKINLVNAIMDYESGQMGEQETLELFSHLIKTGLAWTLQGSYGRTAMEFIKAGLITQSGDIVEPKEVQ